MKRTGEILRKAREAKGLSLNELALSLKINSKALTAIEEGDLSRLPAKTFLRGFVQSYAQALKIDTDEVLSVFAEEMGSTRPQPLMPPGASAPAATSSTIPASTTTATESVEAKDGPSQNPSQAGLAGLEEPSRARMVVVSIVSLILVFMIFGTKKIIDRYQRESEPADINIGTPLMVETPQAEAPAEEVAEASPIPAISTEPAAATPSPVAVPDATTPAPTSTAAPTAPSKPETPAVVRSEPAAPVETSQASPVKPVESKPAEPPAPEKKPEVAATAPAASPPAAPAKPVEAPKPASPVAKPIEMIIEAMDEVEIAYSGAGGAAQKIKLIEGQVHTIRGRGALKMSVSDGGVVNLILNGRDLGAPGVLGKPVQLTY